MDAFSAQLAAADKAAKKSAKKPKKITRISAESIQSSLMESLKNPTLIGGEKWWGDDRIALIGIIN